MPIYGYRCSECGHELEVFQSMSDQPLRACPDCAGALRKMLYPVGVHFKGSGFYTTDYKTGSHAKAGTTNGSSSSDSAGGDEGSSEKKTDSSSDKKAESTVTNKE